MIAANDLLTRSTHFQSIFPAMSRDLSSLCLQMNVTIWKVKAHLLPLHLLVDDCGLTWHKGGVAALTLASSSDVLVTPDPRTRLVPSLASARHAIESLQHLSTTFELLRLAPQVLQHDFFFA